MKNKKIITIVIFILILIILITIANLLKQAKKQDDANFKILTSFYPIYIMTTNITDGASGVDVSNMAEHITGCIHDYTLTVADLRKFEDADVFIQNGKKLESFTDKIIELYPNVKIIESGENVDNLIEDEEEINAHIWLSIDNYISQINNIASNLSKLNPENAEIYAKNRTEYLEKLNKLKIEYNTIINLQNKKAICLNDSLEYLLNDMKIDVTSIETNHEESVLSAETLRNIINKMKKENIKTIFVDKDDNIKTAQILADETEAKIYTLDSGMSGNGIKEDYINVMQYNLEVLRNIQF